jgi:prepilin-type N-terminal cleavage/methylation domain-containing protein
MAVEIKKDKNKWGFTLIELLVALAIFSTFIVSVTAVALSVIESQRRAFAIQNLQESGRFVVEAITKEIRISKINSVSGDGSILNITNSDGETFDYQFYSGLGQLYRAGEPMSPENVTLTGAFSVRDISTKPFVTIVMKLVSASNPPVEIYLQSSVAPRSR